MLIVIVLGLGAISGYLYYKVQTATHDPAIWHVDPLTVAPSETPDYFRVAPPDFTEYPVGMPAPIYEARAQTLAAAFDAFAMQQPRVERVAGSVAEGWITYVQRTELLRVPDYISVRFYDLEETPEAPVEAPAATDGGDSGDERTATQVAPEPVVASGRPPRATIAIYSRSRYGYGDMGVNEARVRSWLTSIESFVE